MEPMDVGVRSSSLEIGLSSHDKVTTREVDIVASKPSCSLQPKVLQALKETYTLEEKNIVRFRDRFQFLEETIICLLDGDEKACAFILVEVCF